MSATPEYYESSVFTSLQSARRGHQSAHESVACIVIRTGFRVEPHELVLYHNCPMCRGQQVRKYGIRRIVTVLAINKGHLNVSLSQSSAYHLESHPYRHCAYTRRTKCTNLHPHVNFTVQYQHHHPNILVLRGRPGHARGHRCPHPKSTAATPLVAADRMILKCLASRA